MTTDFSLMKKSICKSMTFDIHGMTCGGFVGGVQRALQKIDGVSDIQVSLHPG
jgi:copper chaperone